MGPSATGVAPARARGPTCIGTMRPMRKTPARCPNVTVIALGGNAGPTRAADLRRLDAALARLSRVLGRGLRASRPWVSPAWPPGLGGPDFVNAVATIPARRPPEAVLARLHAVEAAMGRVRRARWGVRPVDLDLVAQGAAVRPDAATQRAWRRLDPARQRREAPGRLILPHPRIEDRAFVLLPLAARAPGWRHPLTGRTVAAMARALPLAARRGLRPLAPPRPARPASLVKRPRRA